MNEELLLIKNFEKNDISFRNGFQELQKKYPNEYVAIKDAELLDHDKNPKALMDRLEAKNEDLFVILIQFIPEKGIQILY